MTKGKKWTTQQENQLKTLIETNTPIPEIANQLDKTPGAIILKSQRLGLNLQTSGYIDKSIPIPRQLPSVEETLKMLAGALKESTKPGLNRLEVNRIQAIATIAKTYKELLSDYINYRGIELKLKEMEQENARLLKEASSNPTPQPNLPPSS
ncbi:MAG TPA: hypothetical protein VLH35_00105 [Candidatus Acidoferrales bacterium]|nr:hypothetical protein [Candidatus Acidoferrales bacterium]